MQLIDSRTISRGMVRVESGEDLVDSLLALATAAGWRDAVVTGAGSLELVEMLLADGRSVTLENAELASLAGRIHRGPDGDPVLALQATVAAATGFHCGRIVAAMTGGLVLVVDAVAGARPAEAVATRTRTEPSPASPAALSPEVPGVVRTPSAVDDERSSASKPLSQSFKTKPIVRPMAGPTVDYDDDEHENPLVNPGDYLKHPQLGLCEVVGDDDSGGVRIRIQGGKTRVLRLEALEVLPGEEDDENRMVFVVTGPRRR